MVDVGRVVGGWAARLLR